MEKETATCVRAGSQATSVAILVCPFRFFRRHVLTFVYTLVRASSAGVGGGACGEGEV